MLYLLHGILLACICGLVLYIIHTINLIMESEEMFQERKEFNRVLNLFCKNSQWEWHFPEDKIIAEDGTESYPEPEFVNLGCGNTREYGSSRCKECSQKYKETGLQYPFIIEDNKETNE